MLSFTVTQALIISTSIWGVSPSYTDKVLQESQIIVKSQILDSSAQSVRIVRDKVKIVRSPIANPELIDRVPLFGEDRQELIDMSLSLIGTSYIANAAQEGVGFDCSGFTMYLYSKIGIDLPHSAMSQMGVGQEVSESEAQPGDLVAWGSHVGIWLSPGIMIDSARPGTVVDVRPIWGNPIIIHIE